MASQHFGAVIVGAGFGGIGAAIQLHRLGYDNFVILEREDDLGGTWLVNHYPGLAVDVPTTTYSYFVRAEPELVAAVLHRRGDQAVRRRRRRQVRRAPPHALQHNGRGSSLGRGRQAMARHARRRRDRSTPASSSPRRAFCLSRSCPRFPASPVSRARSSTPRIGTTLTTRPVAASRSSAPVRRRFSSSPSWRRRPPI